MRRDRLGQDLVIEALERLDLIRSPELFQRAAPAGFAEPPTKAGVAGEQRQLVGHRMGVPPRHDEPRLAIGHVLGEPVGVRADDGQLHGLRLDDGIAEPLGNGRVQRTSAHAISVRTSAGGRPPRRWTTCSSPSSCRASSTAGVRPVPHDPALEVHPAVLEQLQRA